MKKALIYLLFFSYALMLARPVVPLIADTIAHAFWYSQHVATVHCVNGKYHVHYQYMNEAQKTFPGKNPQHSNSETFFGDHLITSQKIDFSFHVMGRKNFREQSTPIPDSYSPVKYPPPKI